MSGIEYRLGRLQSQVDRIDELVAAKRIPSQRDTELPKLKKRVAILEAQMTECLELLRAIEEALGREDRLR
jgi:primosomal protein N''